MQSLNAVQTLVPTLVAMLLTSRSPVGRVEADGLSRRVIERVQHHSEAPSCGRDMGQHRRSAQPVGVITATVM